MTSVQLRATIGVALHTAILAALLLALAVLGSFYYWVFSGLHGWTPWLYWEVWGAVIAALSFFNLLVNGPMIAETESLRDEAQRLSSQLASNRRGVVLPPHGADGGEPVFDQAWPLRSKSPGGRD